MSIRSTGGKCFQYCWTLRLPSYIHKGFYKEGKQHDSTNQTIVLLNLEPTCLMGGVCNNRYDKYASLSV